MRKPKRSGWRIAQRQDQRCASIAGEQLVAIHAHQLVLRRGTADERRDAFLGMAPDRHAVDGDEFVAGAHLRGQAGAVDAPHQHAVLDQLRDDRRAGEEAVKQFFGRINIRVAVLQ